MTELAQPEPLQEWFNRQRAETSDDMFYKGASAQQIMFVRDKLAGLVGCGLGYEQKRDLVYVIATHTSKSVLLPVYSMTRPDLSLRIVLRDNFYNWKLSVVSSIPIEADFAGLFHTTPPIEPEYTGNHLSPVYFEGFPESLIFGYYEPSDKKCFSAELWSDHALWTTLFLIMRARGAIEPMKWHTRESHRAELERERLSSKKADAP